MNYAAFDAAIAALSQHRSECGAEQAEARISSSITDEYHRALNHDENHLLQIVEALEQQRALMVQIQTKINEITAYLANIDALKLKVGGVPGDL